MKHSPSKATPDSKQVDIHISVRCCSLLHVFRAFIDKANAGIEHNSFPLWRNGHGPKLKNLIESNVRKKNTDLIQLLGEN